MKIISLILVVLVITTNAQKNFEITNLQAKKIAEQYVACSGFTKSRPSENFCLEYKKICNNENFPCKFLQKEAFGYIFEENSWIIIFRTRGKLKSKTTGARIKINIDGSEVKIESKKIFLKYVENKF